MHSLPLFHRLDGRAVLLLGEGEAAEAKRRLLERAGAQVTDDPAAAVSLAFVVLGDDDAAQGGARGGVDRAAVDALKARGVLVNVVDHPALCDFTTPAIVDRDPVLIAIGTGGASAGLAKAVRQRLEAMLPGTLGALATALLHGRRSIHARWRDAGQRRRAIDAALDPGGVLDPLQIGATSAAVDSAVAQWVDTADQVQSGRIERVRLSSDDADDLTLRMARLLGQADVLWHDGSVADAILNRARADAARVVSLAPPETPDSGLIVWLEYAR